MGATLALLSKCFYNRFKLVLFCLFYYQNVMHALSMSNEMSANTLSVYHVIVQCKSFLFISSICSYVVIYSFP